MSVSEAEVKSDVPQPKPNNKRRARLIKIFTFILLVIGIIVFLLWLFYYRFHESTDDAYANGNMININPAVKGSVIAFYADNTDLVKEGQILAQLDPTKYQIEYEQGLATLGAQVLEVKQLYERVKALKATRNSKLVAMKKAKYDYDNRAQLISSLAVSNEEFIHARDDLTIAESELKVAESQLKIAKDAVGTTKLEDHPLIEQQKAKVREAYYNLKHCVIYAPSTGYVAQRFVNVGEWVEPTTPLMAVIPTNYVWVDANFKETQLRYMRVGQPAKVTLDIYGSSVVYEGHVLGIASGTGSLFSLIPPQNATGNWIKIVQRLPVRISLDPEKLPNYPVRLGLSAYVDVNISNLDLPMLVQNVVERQVAMTKVFDIDLTEVNEEINKIIGGK